MIDLAALTADLADKHAVTGFATAVIRSGETDVAVHGTDVDTMHFIGSTTKTLTATALMTFVDRGAISLDDYVRDVLPEAKLAEAITVGMLLDHTSGFRGDSLEDTGWGDDALERVVRNCLPHEPQVTEPGVVVSYNNAALIVAGRLVEVLSGAPFPQALRTLVLDPLDMAQSTLLPWEATGRPVAIGHLEGSPVPGWPVKRSWGPAGGLASSIGDQVRWARFCLDGGPVLSDATRLAMQQPRAYSRSGITATGASWLLQDRGDLRLVTHGGNVNNLHLGTFVLVPSIGVAVLALSSSRGGMAAGRELVDLVLEDLGHPAPPALPATPVSSDVVGRYDGGAWQQQISCTDGTLFTQMVLPEDAAPELKALFANPPAELVSVGTDQLALAARPWDVVGDIGRDADGHVAWLRWGMRVFPRLPEED